MLQNLSSVLALAVAFASSCAALSAPPSGAITIGGSSGKYKTISAALSDTSSSIYFIYAVSDLENSQEDTKALFSHFAFF